MKRLSAILECIIIPSLFLTLFCGCAGRYGQFYRGAKHPPTKNVKVYKYTEDGLNRLKNSGYAVIGASSFNGPYESQDAAIIQAKNVGAHIVLLDSKYTGTQQGVVPLTQYHPGQTNTVTSNESGSFNVYGSGGYGYGTYSGSSTSYVHQPGYSTTSYFPYSVSRYDQKAIFLRKKGGGQEKLRDDQADRLNFFLGSYCWTYSIKDVDEFATLFAHDAIENGKPFISCLPQYRRNLAKIDSIDYQIKPNRYAIHKGTGLIRMKGTFYFKARLSDSGKWQEKTGNISMDLIESGDSYLVKRLNYTSQSAKKVKKQSQWGPWKEIENKK
jgi:hypothetical protein